MVAGLATLRILARPGMYEHLERTARAAEEILRSAAEGAGVPVRIQRVGTMMTVFFSDPETPVRNLDDVQATNLDLFPKWHRTLLANGVYWPASNFEASFMSLSHGPAELEVLDQAARAAFAAVA